MIQNPGHLQGLRPLPICLVRAPRQAHPLGLFCFASTVFPPSPSWPSLFLFWWHCHATQLQFRLSTNGKYQNIRENTKARICVIPSPGATSRRKGWATKCPSRHRAQENIPQPAALPEGYSAQVGWCTVSQQPMQRNWALPTQKKQSRVTNTKPWAPNLRSSVMTRTK